jgi:hypothetical protein
LETRGVEVEDALPLPRADHPPRVLRSSGGVSIRKRLVRLGHDGALRTSDAPRRRGGIT